MLKYSIIKKGNDGRNNKKIIRIFQRKQDKRNRNSRNIRKNGHSKPTIEQLITICEKLALSLDELTGINKNDIQAAYDKADPAIQEAVRKLLDIEIEKTTIKELEEEHELIS